MLQKIRMLLTRYPHILYRSLALIILIPTLIAQYKGVESYSFYGQGKWGNKEVTIPYLFNYLIVLLLLLFSLKKRI
jgi:hypothetical protein